MSEWGLRVQVIGREGMQDMRYDEEFGSSDFCSCKGPQIVNDISNGYRQTIQAEYYKATMETFRAEAGERISFALVNPKTSGVSICISQMLYINFSAIPLGVTTYFASKIGGNIEIGEWIRSTNTYHCGKESRVNVYFGRNLMLKGCHAESRISVQPYETDAYEMRGEIWIAPGSSYVAELTPLVAGDGFMAAVSGQWWEEPVI